MAPYNLFLIQISIVFVKIYVSGIMLDKLAFGDIDCWIGTNVAFETTRNTKVLEEELLACCNDYPVSLKYDRGYIIGDC